MFAIAFIIGLLDPLRPRRRLRRRLAARRAASTAERLVRSRRAAQPLQLGTAGASRRAGARGSRPSGLVGRRLRRGRAASATCSRIRSVASSRFRSCERSSWAIARTSGPSFASTRRRSGSLQARGCLDVEERLDPRRALLRVLAAGAARPGEAERQFRPNRLGVHGGDSARRGRCAARLRRADPGRGRRGPASARRRAPHPLRHELDHDVARTSSASACARWASRSTTTSCRRPAASPRGCSPASACSR